MCELTKKCKACLEEKCISDFYKNKKSSNGYDHRCKICKKNKIQLDLGELFIEKLKLEKKGEYELVGEYFINSHLNILHKNCGKIWKVLRTNVFKRRCGHCSLINKSSLSSKIENYLSKKSICFKTEVTFSGCKNLRLLPFDYAILDCEGVITNLIEADGEQHYRETGYSKGGLIEVQKRDQIKNKFCKENNIPLLRISYMQEDSVEEILNEYFTNIECKCENEIREYYSKTNISQAIASEMRRMYLNDGYSIKKVSNELGYSETGITKVIKYITYPFTDLEIKNLILAKYENLQPKNRSLKDLNVQEIETIINMKSNCISDTEISKKFMLCRKSFNKFIDNWGSLCLKPKPIPIGKVISLSTGTEYQSIHKGCKQEGYMIATEIYRIKHNLHNRAFDRVKE